MADALVFWESYDDGWVAWPAWPPALRQDLRDAYDAIAAGVEPIEPAIDNEWSLELDDDVFGMAVRDEAARRLYLSHVAGSLHTEIAGLVPWSLVDIADDAASMTALFDARESYYETVRACVPLDHSYVGEFYSAMPDAADCADTAFWAQAGGVVPMEASKTWDALVAHGFLGATRLEAIDAVLQWERTHLFHFSAGSIPSPASIAEWYWTRRSLPPAEVMLEGHVPVGPHPVSGNTTSHPYWSRGCGSVGNLAAALLRVANVPVTTPSMQGGHAGIHFPSEDAWLDHGDTIYSSTWKYEAAYSPTDLLLDGAQWAEWFPVSSTVYFEKPVVYSNEHMGVVPRLMFLALLPDRVPDTLVSRYCADQASGAAPADGQVYDLFEDDFTVTELEIDWDLWGWLELHAVGVCP